MVGEPVDVEFYNPDNPLLHLPPTTNTAAANADKSHPLAPLLPPEVYAREAANANQQRPFVFLSVFKVPFEF